jgi:HK97 family phage major capsid protein
MLATDTALGQSVVADLISTIGPIGAGARLLQAGLQLVFDRAATITVPGLEASADKVSFVAEGAPIPVRELASKSVALVPHKMAVIVAVSTETLAGSNAEAVVTNALIRSTGLALDAALFDAAAADPVRPAGLRHGITALAPAATGNPDDDMIEDLTLLASAVAPIGGPIMFVASPERAVAISLRARRELPFAVLGSPAVAARRRCVRTEL